MVFHFFLISFENGRDFLGFTMIIPLLAVFLVQKMWGRLPIFHTFSLTKPSSKWVFISIIVPIVMGIGLHTYFYVTHGDFFLITKPLPFIALLLIGLTISAFSALVEEVIWRGNYYYYLRQRFSFWPTALFIGVIWSLWHLPIALLYKSYTTPVLSFPVYLFILFALSLVLSIIREVAQSIIPVALLHGMMNVFYLSDGQQMSVTTDFQEWLKCIGIVLLFIVCILLLRHKIVTISKK